MTAHGSCSRNVARMETEDHVTWTHTVGEITGQRNRERAARLFPEFVEAEESGQSRRQLDSYKSHGFPVREMLAYQELFVAWLKLQPAKARQGVSIKERAAFTPAEFAALCGRSTTWGYRQIYAGRVQPISDCGRLLIPRSEVDSFLSRKREYNPA